MTAHGWERDAWPSIYQRVMATTDILVIAGVDLAG